MMGVMKLFISYDSTSSFMMLACLPTELSNFLTIRPLNSQIYIHRDADENESSLRN